MNTRPANLLSLLFVAVLSAVAITLYPVLPDPVPTHWNAAGEIDGYTSKPLGVILMPLFAAGIWLLMKAIPRMSPKGFGTGEFQGVVNLLQVVMVGFMSVIGVFALLAARGLPVPLGSVIPLAVGLLFIVLANYFGKLRKNFFIGIRTPWTIASDEVWSRTHRLGSRTFALAGLVMAVSAFLPQVQGLVFAVVAASVLVPVVYSWWLYRRLEGFGDDEPTA